MNITICYIFIFLTEAFILKQYCCALFLSKYSYKKECGFIFLFYSFLFFISQFELPLLNTISFLLINFFLIFLLYEINATSAFFHSIIVTLVMGFCEIAVACAHSQLILNFYEPNSYFENLLFLAIFSKLIYFYILFILSHFFAKSREHNQIHGKELFLLSIVPIISLWILVTFSVIGYSIPLSQEINTMITVSSILLLISNIAIWEIYLYSNEKNLEFTNIQLDLQKEYDSVQYYKMMSAQNEAQNILIHDIKKHLHSIALLNEQKKYDHISAYINEIIDSSDLQTPVRICDNEFLNVILSRYVQKCSEKNILFRIDIRRQCLNFVKENDLTALFCNLLDNAFEAACKQENSFIELTIIQKPTTHLTVITMKNSCNKNPFHKTTKKLVSTKIADGYHGFGIKSIKRIIKNYNGNAEFYYDETEKCFHSIITLTNSNF